MREAAQTQDEPTQPTSWQRVPPADADALVVGAPFDGTSGGRPRQARAPDLLRSALELAETDDGAPVWDAGDVLVDPIEPEPTLARLEATIERACAQAPSALPVVLGGEHTVSLAAVRALQPASIVSLDAHPDLWDDQHGRSIAQGTWLRRACERSDAEVVVLGARAARGAETEAMEELGVRTELPAKLPEPVYLTVDIDVLDPQQAPGVVWPEPDGPGLDEVAELVGAVAGDHELAGVDLVEVNAAGPGPTVDAAAHLLQQALAAAGGDAGTR
ncbi:hypothetical protein BRD56_06165 [Thermoplasmatales archaeon SW_10_69_26]|nr:MAG: hypothetical protein BRD56_06165 [Thermoplasmatales archaeon SW_10_69_26]